MLFSVEQAFVGREEIRAPLKTPAWEAMLYLVLQPFNRLGPKSVQHQFSPNNTPHQQINKSKGYENY